MPTCLAALMIKVPGAAVTGLPSIVRLIRSAIFEFGSLSSGEHRLRCMRVRAWPAVQVGFEIFRKLLHNGYRGHRGRVTQGAKCAAKHVLGQFADERNIAFLAHSLMESLQHLSEP